MKVLLVGGGTGGHITPLLAVAHELKVADPDCRLMYVGERGGKFTGLTREHALIDDARYIFAGKFRRYHGESWTRRLLDVKTNLKNLRDAFLAFFGFCQALWLLMTRRPDVIFIKGGFVGVPVGLAAALCRIPYVTHDSDTVPGLANRIIGRWARMHATGMPAEFYNYPKDKIRFTGIPVAAAFAPSTPARLATARGGYSIPADAKVILVTGGSQGSRRVNTAVRSVVPSLLDEFQDLYVIHHIGKGNSALYDSFEHPRLRHEEFIPDFHNAMMAADVVIARSSATTIAELAIEAKATIVVPSPFLAGGHQLKNASHLAAQQAVVSLDEASVLHDPTLLADAVRNLLKDKKARQILAANLSKLARPDAAQQIAKLLFEIAAP